MVIIFDLDGTILDTYPMIRENFVQLFKNFLPDYNYNENDLKSFFGPGLMETFKKIGCDLELSKKLFIEYCKISPSLMDDYLRQFPGTHETLKVLKEKGYKLAIYSNKTKESILLGINHQKIAYLFDYIVGIDGVKSPKPNPEGINIIRDFYKEECVYIGDTITDIKTGINANCLVIGAGYALTPAKVLYDAGAKYVAREFKDYIEIMEKIYE